MASDLAQIGPYSKVRSKSVLLASLFVLTMAFDFKGREGGSSIQFAMAAINGAVFLLLALRCGLTLPGRGTAAYIVWGWLLFLLVGSVGAIASKVPWGQYIRIFISYSLFLEGFLVAWWLSRFTGADQVLLKMMILSAIISVTFTVFWGFFFTGKSLLTIRFWILSPLVPFLLVAAVYDLVFSRRRRIWTALMLVLLGTIIAISLTRGVLLFIAFTASAAILGWVWNIIRGRRVNTKPLVRSVGWIVLIGMIGLIVATQFDAHILNRWMDRTVGAGYDVNFWTRVAAVAGQWRDLTRNSTSWLVGLGFGHDYSRSADWFHLVSGYIPSGIYFTRFWYPSEFMWISLWFYGGFIAGSFGLVALLVGAITSFRVFSATLRSRNWHMATFRPTMIGFLGYMSFLGISFTSSPFLSRLAPMFMGLCLGLACSMPVRGDSPEQVL